MSADYTSIKLKTFPNTSLRTKSIPFNDFELVDHIYDNMIKIMYENSGIGLAANQVGLHVRLFVMDLSENKTHPELIINPEIIGFSDKKHTMDEGCLSLPGIWHKVSRPETVTIRYLDSTQKVHEREYTGLASSCIQHEIDHLNGVLFPDRILPTKQAALWKKYLTSIKRK